MSQRKLQQEVDKVLKKVKEGLVEFDSIYEKFHTIDADNQSYREKLESDLKREIKKLQKHREHIKSWLSKDDIKDKQSILLENRKLIENGMERFKSVEKIMKTKKFSTEALSNPDLIQDPNELKKREQLIFVEECLEELQKQLESYETQQDMDRVKRHQFHIANLENILRLLQHNELDPEIIGEFQDDIKYYVDNNDDPDFIEYDTIYEDMGCEVQLEDIDDQYSSLSSPYQRQQQQTPVKSKSVKIDRSPKKKPSPGPSLSKCTESSTNLVLPASTPLVTSVHTVTLPLNTKAKKDSTLQLNNYSLPPPKDLSQDIEDIIQRDQHERSAFKDPLFQNELPYWLQSKRALMQPYNPMPEKMIKQLESSLLNCPDSLDADTPHLYQFPLSLPHPTSIFFPNEPIRFVSVENNSKYSDIYSRTSTARIMTKFDLDTLFFIFYHYQGTYEQFLSSRELTHRNWKFNKLNHCWFHKETEKSSPVVGDQEEASWRYFDYQKSWLSRRCGADFQYREEEFEKL